MGGLKDAKEGVHEALQESGRTAGFLDGCVLVKWVAVCDFALPDGSHATLKMSSDVSGRVLLAWEAEGLLLNALVRSVSA